LFVKIGFCCLKHGFRLWQAPGAPRGPEGRRRRLLTL